MNRSILAGLALAGALVVAAPVVAFSANTEAQTNEAGRLDRGPRWHSHMGHGSGDQPDSGGMMMRRPMMHRMSSLAPRERCIHRLARRAGRFAYTGALLNLTPEQRPLWDRLSAAVQQQIDAGRQLCAALGERAEHPSVLDRLAQRERFLSARLQAVQQIRPPLEQLYGALTPEQKEIVDRSLSERNPR